MSGCTPQEIRQALQLNDMLATCYRGKFKSIPRDEFLSVGLIGIAKANKRFQNGNWSGYVKVAIQNEMNRYLKFYVRQERVKQKAWRIHYTEQARVIY